MRYLVTGWAGFVGAHVCEALLERGHEVDCVDAFTDYYDLSIKRANAARLARHDGFQGLELDLARADLDDVVAGADAVIHLAAQPVSACRGRRASWSRSSATSRHRSGCWRRRGGRVVPRLVLASSSVSGNATEQPIGEDAPTRPFSPYGVTKLAMEHLASAYGANGASPRWLCATSPSTARGNAPTWASTGSSPRWPPGGRCPCTATASRSVGRHREPPEARDSSGRALGLYDLENDAPEKDDLMGSDPERGQAVCSLVQGLPAQPA